MQKMRSQRKQPKQFKTYVKNGRKKYKRTNRKTFSDFINQSTCGRRGQNPLIKPFDFDKAAMDYKILHSRRKFVDTPLLQALTSAREFGSKETVELLIKEWNADVHDLNQRGRNCFLWAALGGNPDIMRYLHSIDANLCKGKDEDGDTALTLASCYGSKETVELLIKEFNADVHELGYRGQNCFLRAVVGQKYDIMRYLYSVDPDLCHQQTQDGSTALSLARKINSKNTEKYLIREFNCWKW